MLKRNVALGPYTTFGIGGRAAYLLEVREPGELVAAVRAARRAGVAYHIIAGGSNVVFGDKLFRGLVIRFKPKVNQRFDLKNPPRSNLKTHWRGLSLTVEANLSLGHLIETAISKGLAGVETLSGIPGTVGGAIVGNAGAFGQTISDCLTRVEIFDGRKIKWLGKKQCRFAYRESIFKQRSWLILRAEFRLSKDNKGELAKKSREIIKIRSKKYNPGLRCPGSFFKNVLVGDVSIRRRGLAKIDKQKIINGKIPAGYLLEAVGAKGMRQGGVYVADFHGNLLINGDRGTYRDVVTLAAKLKKLVQKKFGITLEEEIRYMV